MKVAMYFNKIEDSKVHCYLCPHNCVIKPGRIGACRVRKNIDGTLYSLNYGKITSMGLDPIEKKPLYRFNPGKMILSVGTFGCNLKCSFCQNWSIAHGNPESVDITPEGLAEKAGELVGRGNIGVAYTYNEPFIWYEFVYETSKLVKDRQLANILVTNGFVNREPLEGILQYIDAFNIDIKAYTAKFYNEICKAELDNVKQTIEISAKKCHVELTTLVVPGLNDTIEEIGSLAQWIASISPEIPLHLSRFFPNYKMKDRAPTPRDTLIKAGNKAREYLKYVYLGNIW